MTSHAATRTDAAAGPPAPGRAARARGREAQRERILDALFAVMSSSGGAAASVSEIAEQAGIARGALHYYFDSKDELGVALMRRLGEAYLRRMTTYFERTRATGVRPTLALVGWHFGVRVGPSTTASTTASTAATPSTMAPSAPSTSIDDAARLLAVWIEFWGQAPARPEIGAVVFEVQEAARQLFAQALADERGVDVDDARGSAAALLALVEGGLLQWRVAATSARPFDRAALGHTLVAAAAAVVDAVAAVDAPALALALSEDRHVRS